MAGRDQQLRQLVRSANEKVEPRRQEQNRAFFEQRHLNSKILFCFVTILKISVNNSTHRYLRKVDCSCKKITSNKHRHLSKFDRTVACTKVDSTKYLGHVPRALFVSLVLLLAAAKREKAKNALEGVALVAGT
jgi:hypothetical protein